MTTKAYVAGRTSNIEGVRVAQQVCRDLNMQITFDWTGSDGEIRSDWKSDPDRARALAEKERHAAITADVLVLLHSDGRGLGKILECGMALAYGVPCILVGEFRECVFWYLDDVTRIDDLSELRDTLLSWFPLAATPSSKAVKMRGL